MFMVRRPLVWLTSLSIAALLLLGVGAQDSPAFASVAEEGALADREVLVALYTAANGPGWYDSTNWLSDRPVGECIRRA